MSNQTFALINAKLVLPDRLVDRGAVVVEHSRISTVIEGHFDRRDQAIREVDLAGAYLMPGIIDLHSDSLEAEVNPRPQANLPLEFALANLERRLILSGVTTQFHAISFMNQEKTSRTVGQAAERAAFIARVRNDPHRVVDHHVLHRLDVWNPDAMDHLFASVRNFPVGYVSLNDHTPGQGQYRDVDHYRSFMKLWRQQRGQDEWTDDDIDGRMATRQADSATVPMVYGRVRAERENWPFMLATHDDDSPEKVDRQWEIGASIAEFPVTLDAARRARDRGMAIAVGAPNIVRGGSTSGNLDARELFAAGLADIMVADYHAPALPLAAFRVFQEGVVDLPTAIRTLTLNPALAMGFADRGAIREGHVADLAVVRVGSDLHPRVETVYRGGREVFTLRELTLVGDATW